MKVLSIPKSDYKVVTRPNGQITLDVGNDGLVLITGDLQVAGDVTTIQSETLTVRDNIIQLNVDDPGDTDGISSVFNRESGIEVNRGQTKPDGYFVLSDAVFSIRANASSQRGTWLFKDANGASMGIQTCSIKTGTNENLFLINQGSGVVTVTGTVDYEKNALDYSAYWPTYPVGVPTLSGPITLTAGGDDVLPNAKALKDYVDSSLFFFDDWQIKELDTSVAIYDKDLTSVGGFYPNRPVGYTPPVATRIVFTVDGSERGQFNVNGLDIDNINLFTNTINNDTANLILTSSATNTVEVDGVLQLDDTTGPTAVSGSTKIYTVNSSSPGPGKTGVYFTSLGNSDELVAKNRALLFSILF